MRWMLCHIVFMTVTSLLLPMVAIAEEPKPLIDLAASDAADRIKPTSTQVTLQSSDKGVDVKVDAGKSGYPGLAIKPEGAFWDLSKYGHIEAKVTNTGDQPILLNLRVDGISEGEPSPWNTEGVRILPGKTGTVKVIFGYQYGMNPGFPLNPAKVKGTLFFINRMEKSTASFRIESIQAAGPAGEKPPVKPDAVRIKPVDGYVFGGHAKFDPAKQLTMEKGMTAEVTGKGLRITFPKNDTPSLVVLRPLIGRWDFRDACEVRVKVKNVGSSPVTPSVQVTSDKRDMSSCVSTDGPLDPGASGEIVVLFEAAKPLVISSEMKPRMLPKEGTGTKLSSDKVDSIRISTQSDAQAVLLVESVMATATPIATPVWLGKRPPVDGDWSLTFNDDFKGESVDLKNWNVLGPNWWGKTKLTHWSKDQLIVKDGVVRMRFEKKAGWHNDTQGSGHQSPYAAGFLDSYGLWRQRYGYFEARMKLPTASGLWPAFWMMSDRGPEAGPQWKRQSTSVDGMEFDIMEHLTRWGPYRFSIAMHWDGYKKDHKATGGTVYVQPDKDGFITSGCLWLPGLLVYYCNGKEILRWESDRIPSVPMCVMFTLPTGGWDNNRLDDSQLPADFVIDYVRVWQRKDLASPVDGYLSKPAGWMTAK